MQFLICNLRWPNYFSCHQKIENNYILNNFCIVLLCTFCVSSMLISEVLCKLRITQRARNMYNFYMTNVTLLWILVCKICKVHSFKFVEYFQFQMDKHAKFIAITSFLLITFNWSSLTPEVVNIHTLNFYILLNNLNVH